MSAPNYANLYLTGSSEGIIDLLKIELQQPNLKVHTKEPKNYDYLVYVVDTIQDETNQTKKILDNLSTNKNSFAKIAVVLVGNEAASKRNHEYYLQVVNSIGGQIPNYRVVQTFDLYHLNGVPIISPFEKEILESIKSKSINVSFNGARALYLTEIRDLAKAIIKSLFVGNTKGKTFTIVGEPITDLEFAYLLKKVFEKNKTTLNIDLNKTYREKDTDYYDRSVQSQAALNWLPEISIADCLNDIVKNYLKEIPEEQIVKASTPLSFTAFPLLTKERERVRLSALKPLEGLKTQNKVEKTENIHQTEKRGLVKIVFITVLMLILSVVVPIVITSTGFYLSTRETYESYQSLRRGNIKESQTRLSRAIKLKKITGFTFKLTIWTGNIISPTVTSQANDYLLILEHGQSILDLAIKSYSLSSHLYSALLGHEILSSDQTAQAIKVNLIALSDNLSEIQLLLSQVKLPFNLGKSLENSDLRFQINTLKSQIQSSLPLLDILDKIIANKNIQRYVILVQDNNELRATGGFLNSLITVTFDQGKVINIQTESSLAVDRLIEGSIQPPEPVRQLLNQANWAFRDSNVDADFGKSAKQITWFIERFKNNQINGLIGINLSLYKLLLKEYGPISLSNNQIVDRDNLNILAENPTSDSSNDFITNLSRAFSEKILNKEINFIPVARSTLESLATNEISLYFKDPVLEQLAETSGVSGHIHKGDCHPQLASHCQSDTVYLNETNFSVAKINYYLKRVQNHNIEINEAGNVTVTLTYNYSFPVPVPTNLQNYKVYYQLYLPTGSTNLAITLDNQKLDQGGFIQTPKGELEKIEFSGSLSLNQNHILKIIFVSPNRLNMKSPQMAYSANFPKQAGTSSDKFIYSLKYPETLNPKVLTLPMKSESAGQLNYQTDRFGDLTFGVLFKNISL